MKQFSKEKKPETFRTMHAPMHGEVGAGQVVPFVPRHETVPVVVPTSMKDDDIGTVTVRGCSLEDEGIDDGDTLLFTRKFTKRDCMFEAICIVFIIATGELVAKKLRFAGDGMITLRASGGGIKDLHYSGEDIEIRGVAFGFQRSLKKDRNRDKSIPF